MKEKLDLKLFSYFASPYSKKFIEMSNAENFLTFCTLDIVMIFSSNFYDKSGPTCIKTAFSELFCHQKFSWVVRTRNF